MSIWYEIEICYQMHKDCFPKGNRAIPPKQYGIALQGKRKKKKKRGNKHA